MLAVDAELPVHTVLSTVLSEQHPQPRQPAAQGGQPSAPSGTASGTPADAGGMRREAPGGAMDGSAALPPLGCGIVSPALPSNVLAEVCEFECVPGRVDTSTSIPEEGPPVDGPAPVVRRQWTSPDDGWGMHLSSIPMQDLEKMPMGMPVTVGELAGFLESACQTPAEPLFQAPQSSQGRWAEAADGSSATQENATASSAAPEASADMLDWSLTQWRAHCLKQSPDQQKAAASNEEASEPTSRILVEESPRGACAGSVLVHQVPLAPPRPILCTDDPEASLLKAVELLLAYPELDALPIVSPVRCTVVAHLTLSYCLAYTLPRMRGADLEPLATLPVRLDLAGGAPVLHKFDSRAHKAETWAERSFEAPPPPMVLSQTQPLRELLAFFQRTPHSGAPVVEDNGNGGVLGMVTRRDLLDYLDLSMQSARRSQAGGDQSLGDIADSVEFDLGAPVEGVLQALRRCRSAGAAADEVSTFAGAAFLRETELPLKELPPRLLAADNRKLLVVQDGGSGTHPKLLRIVSASDVWRLLLGTDQGTGDTAKRVAEEPLVAQDL